ncbi:hypothetical protein CH330_01015 [candidate division WOR-3 bacterium JGI_Cruoil_03_51_56]|uniref:Serine protease n=1 Tax=candidate division WOR-3 bacterium JGI_Cruoil_03_51_56 TaxID=1973747 RepID=A0A235BXY8_UNCW3|nr:MAG: hypothetical protein CH330_01015 [candidate division WOR-3 bacterium JGI_Cruoil_03_51_56]
MCSRNPPGTSRPGRKAKLRRTAIVAAALIIASCSVSLAHENPGASFLLIWPSARSTALGGASVALGEDPDASYWNPGGIGLQKSLSLSLSSGEWLPGLYPGMTYAFAGGSYCILNALGNGIDLGFGANATYLTLGETDVINEHGEFLGRYTTWRGAFGLHGGVGLLDGKLGVGAAVKLVRQSRAPDWVWSDMPELGIDARGTGGSFAADIGVLCHLIPDLSAGLALANLGPDMAYDSGGGEPNPLPTMLRVGLCWTPVSNRYVRLKVLPEADKILVGMFYDPDGTKTFDQLLGQELRDIWKSLGIEVTALDILSLRLGYFEDLTGQRGGIVLEKDGVTSHFGIGEALTRTGLGRFKSLGLCWGIGLGWKDYIRLDLSSDAAIYDFPTTNVKVALTMNDVVGLAAEVRRLLPSPRGRSPIPPGGYAPGPRETHYTGSGVLLSQSGLFATCQHVIDDATTIEVDFPEQGTYYTAKVEVEDAQNDLAILRLSLPEQKDSIDVPFALLQPGSARLGMETFTLGFPLTGILGKSLKFNSGSVSALTGLQDNPTLVQIENPVQPGNSGGPLFSADGKLLGIVVSRLNALVVFRLQGTLSENVNFAVKVGYLRNLLAGLPEGKEILARKSRIKGGKTEDVVEQLKPYIGYVRVKVVK